MKILIVYPGPIHSTYDVAAGYERALGNLGHEVVPFPFHQYVSFYEGAFRHWSQVNPDFIFDPVEITKSGAERLIIDLVDEAPDVVLVVEGLALHARAYALAQRLGARIVLLLTESPYLDRDQAELIESAGARAVFTNERASVGPLAASCDVAVRYLPHSYDPEIHRPQAVGADYASDLFFFGTMWPERQALLDSLADLPFEIRTGGYRLGVTMNAGSTIPNPEMAKLYNGTRIALNHHRRPMPEQGASAAEPESVGPRAIEIAACGAFQLSDHRVELEEIFGDSVPTYDGPEDLRAKVRHFLAHDDERQALAAEARRRVAGCTFDQRCREILLPVLEEVAS